MFGLRKKIAQKCFKFYLDGTFEEKNFVIDRNKIVDGKERVLFEPQCVFAERKKRRIALRKPRRMMLFVDGAFHALKFAKGDDTLQPYWTKDEARKFVNKEIEKSLTEHKPMKMSMFIILLLVLLAILGVSVRVAMTIGAF